MPRKVPGVWQPLQSMMVTKYSPRCVWLWAKADGTDRRLQATKAAQIIDLMELL